MNGNDLGSSSDFFIIVNEKSHFGYFKKLPKTSAPDLRPDEPAQNQRGISREKGASITKHMETSALHDERLHYPDGIGGLISKALLYNDVSTSDGFDYFEEDEDGVISKQDLLITSHHLDLFEQTYYPITEADILQWHTRVNISQSGSLDLAEWCRALEAADPDMFEFVEKSLDALAAEAPAQASATAVAEHAEDVSKKLVMDQETQSDPPEHLCPDPSGSTIVNENVHRLGRRHVRDGRQATRAACSGHANSARRSHSPTHSARCSRSPSCPTPSARNLVLNPPMKELMMTLTL